ncbi:MAG: hypothetical protein SF051_10595 [Elusimicrobiota bacterium]|nr:hypothetical protein [Elusimicrobiota bacterium]
MRVVHLDDRTTLLAFRGVAFLATTAMLVHSQRQEQAFEFAPFLLGAFYLFTAFVLWYSRDPRLRAPLVQGAQLLWDVGVISAQLYFSEGFDDELYVMYFLILFMSAMLAKPWQSFLVGTVASLLYAALWNKGHVAADLPVTNLLLRFAFFYVAAFFAAILAAKERDRDEKVKAIELRFHLERLANGGWGAPPPEDLEPGVAKTVRTLDSLLDNMSAALKRVMDQNDELRRAAQIALLQLAHERERLEAEKKRETSAKDPS